MTRIAINLLNLKHRVQSRSCARVPRVFVNSIPKAGTNLVVSLALAYKRIAVSGPLIAPFADEAMFRNRPGLIFGHVETLGGTIASLGLEAGFLMVRSPEGYVMSLARYIESNRRHPAHKLLAGAESDRLFEVIVKGTRLEGFSLAAVDARYRKYLETAERAGLRIVDFDTLRSCPQGDGAAAELMRVIGGANYAIRFEEMLALSKQTSTTYRHSARALIPTDMPAQLRDHPNFREAIRLYDRSLSR